MKKYQALYLRIRNQIETGILKAGERLPSIREEAGVSGLSVNTVIAAYNMLADEGLIRPRERGGYYILAGALSLTDRGIGHPLSSPDRFSSTGRETGERLDQLYERLLHIDPSFATAAPGADLLPSGELARIAGNLSHTWMAYDNPEGDLGLRRRITVTCQDADGPADPGEIMVTNGATEAMAIVIRALVRPGDTVAVESPTYMNFFRQLALPEIRIVEIPVGGNGMDLDILEDELEKQAVRMIITQPNVQNPTGTTMNDAAKIRLIDLAVRHDAWLVQDDVYGDLYFGAMRPRNLTALSDAPQIILISSYSKSLSPGLRVGYLRTKYPVGHFIEEKLRASMDTCRAAQAILTGFIGTTAHRRHLKSIRQALKARIDEHILRLSEVLPRGSYVRRPTGGCLIWIALPGTVNATRVFEECAGKGFIAAPGDLFSGGSFFNNHIRLNAGTQLTKNRALALAILGETVQKNS